MICDVGLSSFFTSTDFNHFDIYNHLLLVLKKIFVFQNMLNFFSRNKKKGGVRKGSKKCAL